MRSQLVICLLAIAAVSLASIWSVKSRIQSHSTKEVHLFTEWRNRQNKLYASPQEESYRLMVFSQNLDKVENINKDQSLTFTAELNKFADLTEEEFVAKYSGLLKTEVHMGPKAEKTKELAPRGLRDDDVDWRRPGAVTDVVTQGQCGDSPYWGAVNAVESAWKLAGNQLVAFSVQQITDCSQDFGNQGCSGGLMTNTFQYLIKDSKGIETAQDYPYTGKDGKCKFDPSKVVGKIRSYGEINSQDCDGLLHALSNQPVSVAVAANALQFYQGGVFNNPRCGTQVNHGASLIGYGGSGNQEFWILRNSWGTDWGEQGYARLFRDDNKREPGMCGICLVASYPVV